MSQLPKLKINIPGSLKDDVCELEQAKLRLDFEGSVILIDGKRVHSYDELVQLAIHDNYKNKEFIEVTLLPIIGGG